MTVHRDKIAKVTWNELTYDPVEIVSSSSLHLDGTMFANGWQVLGDTQLEPDPPNLEAYKAPVKSDPLNFGGWAINASGTVGFSGSVLFGWLDNPGGGGTGIGGFQYGPYVRTFYYEKTVTGLTPGDTVTFVVDISWTLDTGGGNLFLEIEGETLVNYPIVDTASVWVDIATMLNDVRYNMATVVPLSGEVTIRMGGVGYYPSANVLVTYQNPAVYSVACGGTATNSFALLTPYQLETIRSRKFPRKGSTRMVLASGEEDTWHHGYDGVFSADVRFIPAVSALTLPDNDGWEDRVSGTATYAGWARFLRHIDKGGSFTFYPDKDNTATSYSCVADGEVQTVPDVEDDMVRSITLRMRTTDASLITGY
jgi:hypothetical protein